MTTTKQTAANSKFLAGVKKTMNAKIYKHCLQIANYDGDQRALDYVQQFFNLPVTIADFEFRADNNVISDRWGRQRADETLEELVARQYANASQQPASQEQPASQPETTQPSAPVAQEPPTLADAIRLLRAHQEQLRAPVDDFTTGYARGLHVAIRILELEATSEVQRKGIAY